MLIVDAHLDIAYNALEWDRDLLQPIARIREAEAGMAQKGRGLNVVNFDELRRGGIGLFFVTMGCRLASMGKRFPGVRTQDIAYAKCKGQLTGNARHAAIGTDLGGGYGKEQSPSDLDTIADLRKIPAILEKRGYSQTDVADIMHGNWVRLLRAAWK